MKIRMRYVSGHSEWWRDSAAVGSIFSAQSIHSVHKKNDQSERRLFLNSSMDRREQILINRARNASHKRQYLKVFGENIAAAGWLTFQTAQ